MTKLLSEQQQMGLTLRRMEQQLVEMKRTVDEIKSTQISLGHEVVNPGMLQEKLDIVFPVNELDKYLELNEKLEASPDLQKLFVSFVHNIIQFYKFVFSF